MTIQSLPISEIHRNERQPREYFDPAALQELADSIKRFGLMQPIEVRPMQPSGVERTAKSTSTRSSRASAAGAPTSSPS